MKRTVKKMIALGLGVACLAGTVVNTMAFTYYPNQKLGDVNGDGEYTAQDQGLLQGLSGTNNSNQERYPERAFRADLNKDGLINEVDTYLLGAIVSNNGKTASECVNLGDLNGDFKRNKYDMELLTAYVSFSDRDTSKFIYANADVNKDGSIDVHDLYALAGMPDYKNIYEQVW